MGTFTIKGPDGGTYDITAPDGATDEQILAFAKTQLSQPKQPEPQKRPKEDISWADVPGHMLSNAGDSAAQFAQNLVQPILDPVGTVKGLYDVGKGVVSKAKGLVVTQDPAEKAKTEEAANAVGTYFADRYGGLDNIKNTLAEDPVGALADASAVLTGGGSIAARGPGIVSRAGQAVRATGSAIDPIANAARVVRGAGTVAGHLLGQTTGAGSMPVQTAFQAGRQGGNAAFTDAMRGNAPVGDVVNMAEDAVRTITNNRSAQYLTDTGSMLASRQAVNIDPIRNALDTARGSVLYHGRTINPAAAAALDDVSRVVDDFANVSSDLGRNPTPHDLDAMKRAVGAIMDKQKIGTNEYRTVKNVYDAIGREIRAQVPAYDDAMRNYAQASDQLGELRRTFAINPNAAADTTARKLLSVTRNNVNTSYGERARLFDVMAREQPDLPAAVAGHAMSSPTPRGLQGYAATGAGFNALMTNPLYLAGLPAFSPRIVGEVVYAGGRAVGTVEDLATRMRISPEALRQSITGAYVAGSASGQRQNAAGNQLLDLYDQRPN